MISTRKLNERETEETKRTLLVGVQRFGEEVVTRENHDDRKVLIHESKNTVLQFARHDGFAVQVRDFLDLEGTY